MEARGERVGARGERGRGRADSAWGRANNAWRCAENAWRRADKDKKWVRAMSYLPAHTHFFYNLHYLFKKTSQSASGPG